MRSDVLSAILLLSGAAIATPQFGEHRRHCSQAVVALAAGIHLNIQGQYAEYNGTLAVEKVETEQAGNSTAFFLAKGQLQSDIQAGQNIRLTNQQIAPAGNPAIPGLAQYAAAQETEKALAAGLTGEYATDKAALDSLKKDITQGIQLNENNLKNVSRCIGVSRRAED